MNVLGVVRLAPGRVGYFDEITRIHLTMSSPEKPVIENMNTENLKKAVRTGAIKLVSGSLNPGTIPPVTEKVAEEISNPEVILGSVDAALTKEAEPAKQEEVLVVESIEEEKNSEDSNEPLEVKIEENEEAVIKEPVVEEVKSETKAPTSKKKKK